MKKKFVLLVAACLCTVAAFASLCACGKTPAETHTHDYGAWHITKDPTCETDGEKQRECTGGDDIQVQKIDKLGHEFVTYISNEDATCTEDGTETAHCTHAGCQETDTRTVKDSKLGHEFVTYISNEDATCTEDGTETAHCTHAGCQETDTRTVKDSKLGHEFLTYTSNGDATCTEDGTETAHCTHAGCQETDTRTAKDSKLGHNFDASSYVSDENGHSHACTRCGVKQEGTASAHTIVNDYECSVCGWHWDGTTSLTYKPNEDVEGGGYTVTGVSNKTLTKVVIPDTHEGKPVTAVYQNAFRESNEPHASTIEEVIFGKNIKSIGFCAFGYITALKNVTIPAGVTSVGNYAFYACSGVETVTIEGGSVSIGQQAFQGCTELQTITIGDGNVTIGKWAFNVCPKLKSLTIGDGVVDIVTCAFIQCAALTNVEFGSGKVTIGDWAFQDCTELKTVTFGGCDVDIAQGGFYQCSALTDVDFGNGDISVGPYTFQSCTKLKTVTFGNGNVVLGTDFVWNCKALTDVVIGNGNAEVGEYAFRNCSLERFKAGDGDIDFGYCAFYFCGQLASITVGDGDVVFETYSVSFCEELTDVTIGEGASVISDDAFYTCASLKNVVVGNNMAEVGWDAFDLCPAVSYTVKDGVNYLGNGAHPYTVLVGAVSKDITSVVMSADTKLVMNRAFYECRALEHVTFGANLKKIGRWAFRDCVLLQDAILPDSVVELENSAFDGCKALGTVTFGKSLQKVGEFAFDGCSAIQTVNIPTLAQWFSIEFAAEQFAEGTNPLSAKGATLYAGGQAVTGDVVIPDGVTSLKPLAFAGYANLKSLKIGKDVTEIGAGALMGCKNVTSLTVAAENGMFAAQYNCVYNIKEMSVALGCSTTKIPDGIRKIPAHVFRYVPLPSTFIIPDSVEEIGEYAFLGCGTFTDLTLGTGLKKVGSWAFAGAMASYTVPVTYHIKDLAKWCEIDFADDGANPLRWESASIYAAPHAGETETEVSNGGAVLTVPEGVEEIKPYAFWNISTQELHLPASVTKIAPTAFGMNCNLSHYEVAEENPTYEVWDCGVVQIATKTLVLGTVPHAGTIGEGVLKIGDYAFSGKIFRNVAIASSVKEIGAHAFESCRIESLTLGSVERIGDWAFADNKSGGEGIATLVIPESVTYIGDSAFYMCGITSLTLGGKVQHIGENAFASNDELASVTVPASVEELGKGAFSCSGLREATFEGTGWTVKDLYGNDVTPTFTDKAAVAAVLRSSSNVWTKNA